MIFTPICVCAYNKHNKEYFCFSYTAISANVFEIRWINIVTQHLANVKTVFSLNSIQTGCLSGFTQRVLQMFSKLAASTLRFYLKVGFCNEIT